ncbi:nuclear transport factor 2 family protein [Arthrobacter zhaoguopingii]|uniref:nuclear transport factor 2 family protein n=1 Tax=Arthrobacter zhaoguopingii TaxID=2681491 RepID=UPI0013567C4E|nr:nuclear transport factor 2 family protein [Arthrobacter zhaoguopingii]
MSSSGADSGTVLVTGATGTTGSRVLRLLLRAGVAARGATRSPGSNRDLVKFDWSDPTTYAAASKGCSALYLVAPVAEPAALDLVKAFTSVAKANGVKRVVVLSSSSLPTDDESIGHPLIEIARYVRSEFEQVAVLRPSWFMSNVIGSTPLARAIRDRAVVVSATGEAKVAFIDPDDIAEVAVKMLQEDEEAFPAGDAVLTGPSTHSFREVASLISREVGHQISHLALDIDDFASFLVESGVPAIPARELAALDRVVAAGAEDRVTDTVERILGRPAHHLEQYIRSHADELRDRGGAGPDREAARDALSTMAWLVDRGRWQDLEALFTQEVSLDYSRARGTSSIISRTELVKNWRERLDPLEASQHVLGGIRASVTGDVARVSANVLAYLLARPTDGGTGELTKNGGQWEVEMVVREGSWRIQSMTASLSWAEGRQDVLEGEQSRSSHA